MLMKDVENDLEGQLMGLDVSPNLNFSVFFSKFRNLKGPVSGYRPANIFASPIDGAFPSGLENLKKHLSSKGGAVIL